MAKPLVLYECQEGVGLITLNKAERMNAYNNAFAEAWFDAYDQAAADPECRIIVVTGAGRGWCAGADLDEQKSNVTMTKSEKQKVDSEAKERWRQSLKTGELVDSKGRWTNHAQTIPKPIIACIQGAVAGGGFSQMMACDMRFAAEGVPITSAFGARGLIAEMGVSKTLPSAIGMGNAMDIMLSSRKFYSEEALQLGIVQRIFPKEKLLESTIAYARDVIRNVPPSSLAVMKQMLLRHVDMPTSQVMRESNRLMQLSLVLPDHKEGVQSWHEKRSPTYAPYSDNHPLVSMMSEITSSKL